MAICSLRFLLFCGLLVVVYHFLPSLRLRRGCLMLANAVFLVPLVPNWQSWGWLALFFVGTYSALRLVRSSAGARLLWLMIVVTVALFLWLKRYSFLEAILPAESVSHGIVLVGLSYMLFKFLHMLVDERQGQLVPFDWLSYLNYQFSFFTLTAGPIQRFNDFHRDWEEMDLRPATPGESFLCWSRLLTGLLKMGIPAALALRFFNRADARISAGDPNILANSLAYFYAYPAYLYFNFSGYTDAMIGAAGLLGFRLPENFNRPFLARNMLDFWERWHMSLSHWIRDYVFMTSYKSAASRFPGTARYWSYLLLFVALFVAGAWHGTTNAFLMFGALNGLGVAGTRVYGDILRSRFGREGMARYQQSRAIECVAVLVTFHYVCLCHLFFSSGVEKAFAILRTAGGALPNVPYSLLAHSGDVRWIAALIGGLFLLVALWNKESLLTAWERLLSRATQSAAAITLLVFSQSMLTALVFCYLWLVGQMAPPVLYMSF